MKKDPIVEILHHEFSRRKARNERYSLRSFSRFLGVDASNLSRILNCRKTPGRLLQKKLAAKLGLTIEDLDGFAAPQNIQDSSYSSHPLSAFEVVSGWQHYAILELFKLNEFNPTAAGIARKLHISTKDASLALKRLEEVGLLSRQSDGTLIPTESSSSSILQHATSAAHRQQQREILDGAIRALDITPIEKRSQSSMTMAIDTENLEEAKALIKRFRRQMGRLLSQSNNLNEVYQLSISLYPVTQPNKQELK